MEGIRHQRRRSSITVFSGGRRISPGCGAQPSYYTRQPGVRQVSLQGVGDEVLEINILYSSKNLRLSVNLLRDPRGKLGPGIIVSLGH